MIFEMYICSSRITIHHSADSVAAVLSVALLPAGTGFSNVLLSATLIFSFGLVFTFILDLFLIMIIQNEFDPVG